MTSGKPSRSGEHYYDSEIALIYLFERTDVAKEVLAKLCERSEGAIDMVWRWIEGAGFPPSADNKIHRQVEEIEAVLSADLRGVIELE